MVALYQVPEKLARVWQESVLQRKISLTAQHDSIAFRRTVLTLHYENIAIRDDIVHREHDHIFANAFLSPASARPAKNSS